MRAVAVEVGEFEVGAAGEDGFDEVGLGHADAEVVVDGPEAGIKEVVRGLGQGQAVLGAIGSLAGMGVDVGGLQGHAGRLRGNQPITRQGAGEVVA